MERRSGRGGPRPRGPFLRRALAFFLPSIVVLTLTAGIVYGVAQQANRIGANDPQIQLAEDAANRLNGGESATSVVGTGRVDLASGLAPFLVVFDAQGAVVASGGTLDGHDPKPPKGVLDAAQNKEWNAVTWQPRDGVRIAVVAVSWKGGSVLAGRSLRIVEDRIESLGLLVSAAWGIGLVAIGAASLIASGLWPEVSARWQSSARDRERPSP